MAERKYWKIEGYSGTEQILDISEPISHFSDSQIEVLLQRLACRNLSDVEILAASKNKRNQTSLLEVSKQNSNGRVTFMCGTNPHFTARIAPG